MNKDCCRVINERRKTDVCLINNNMILFVVIHFITTRFLKICHNILFINYFTITIIVIITIVLITIYFFIKRNHLIIWKKIVGVGMVIRIGVRRWNNITRRERLEWKRRMRSIRIRMRRKDAT